MVVLIVDDDFASLRALRTILRQHETHLASDTASAVELAERLQPDAIIVDVFLGMESGIDAVRKLRLTACRPLIVSVTGSPSWELMTQTFEAGARAFVERIDLQAMPGILDYLLPVWLDEIRETADP